MLAMRANIYGILSRLLGKELSLEFVTELQGIGFLDLLSSMDRGFVKPEDCRTIDCEFLAMEYARLFIGPGPHVPPYASVHREDGAKAGELWGNSTGEIKRFLEFYGLKLSTKGIIPDHISVLFEFMERLIQARLKAVEEKDTNAASKANSIQKIFFNDHIAPWIERFICRVREMNPDALYGSIVMLIETFIEYESGRFTEAV